MFLVNLHFFVFTGKHVEEDDDDEEEEDCGGGGETSEDGDSGSEERPEEDAGSGNNAEDKDASNEKEIDTMLVDEKQETFDDLPGKEGFHFPQHVTPSSHKFVKNQLSISYYKRTIKSFACPEII